MAQELNNYKDQLVDAQKASQTEINNLANLRQRL